MSARVILKIRSGLEKEKDSPTFIYPKQRILYEVDYPGTPEN